MTTAIKTHRALATSKPTLLSRMLATAAVMRQRRKLAKLDNASLADLGITRKEAERESKRPAWDAPAHWHR